MWDLAVQGEKQGVLFFVALYTSVIMTASVLYQFHVRTWPETRGTLRRSGLAKFGATERLTSNQDYRADALYDYIVNGETYTGKRVSPWVMVASHNARFLLERQLDKIRRFDDGTVAVFYNPARPAKSFLIKPGNVGLAFCVVIAAVPLPWYWIAYPI